MGIPEQDKIHHRQISVFLCLALATVLASVAGYRLANKPYVLYRQAEGLLHSGKDQQALELFEQSLGQGVDLPLAGFDAAEAALRLDRPEQAEALLTASLDAENPLDPGNVGRAAGLLDQYGQPHRALALYERYADKADYGQTQLLHLGELLRRDFQYDRALEVYGQVLAQDPGSLRAGLGLAETLGWLGRYKQALDQCRDLLAAHPDSRNARILYARILSWSGDLEGAIGQYQHILGESP